MELNKELISKIASDYGITAEDFTAKLTSEEPQELNLAGQLFTEKELQSRDSGKFNEGKTMMSERIAKDFKQKYNYELDGVKDFEKVLEHHNEQIKSKFSKNGSERVSELESDLKKQRETYELELENLKKVNSDFETKYKNQNLKNMLLANMPKETVLKPEAIITLYNSEREIDFLENVPVLKKNGEVVKDLKTTEPISVTNDFNEWLIKEKYVKINPGRGEGNDYGGGNYDSKMSPEAFQEKWQGDNPGMSTTSQKYMEDYGKFRSSQRKTA